MAERLPTFRQASIPQHGVIEGGPLDGWSYGLHAIKVEGRTVTLDVGATPPLWPFPTLVRLGVNDFERLTNADPKVRQLNTQALIATAIENEKYKK